MALYIAMYDWLYQHAAQQLEYKHVIEHCHMCGTKSSPLG